MPSYIRISPNLLLLSLPLSCFANDPYHPLEQIYEKEKAHEIVIEEFHDVLDQNPSSENTLKHTATQTTLSANTPKSIIELKPGYVFFYDSKMNKIYKNGGLSLQLAGSFTVQKYLQIYGCIGYQERSGKSLYLHEKTRIWQIPIDLGLKPVFKIADTVQYFFAIGPRYFYLHQHNKSSYVQKNVGRSDVGFFVNTGLNFSPYKGLNVGLFGEYSYQKVNFHYAKTYTYGGKTQMGNLVFGVSFGYKF